MVSPLLLLPVLFAVDLMLGTVAALIAGIVFSPFFPAVGTHLSVVRICSSFIAMVVASAVALAFR